jgi:hypothetical protein
LATVLAIAADRIKGLQEGSDVQQALKAGAIYFALMFAIGCVLGSVRVLLVAPRLGEVRAVLLELTVMLGLSWVVVGWLVRRFAVPRKLGARLAMGILAFVLLIAAETVLAAFGFRRTLAEQAASYETVAGAMGLAGQMLFALFPLLRR